ncbi:hypothetical protein CRG98_043406 [Punica granatum]|uniref:Uncharacterized protein n=1 Tax=Punica granatum TaxID=22663 RepID=A0A2I0HXF8_PUNGR|nr:hypothetical protein CRG98_043406 [Punica granatum]
MRPDPNAWKDPTWTAAFYREVHEAIGVPRENALRIGNGTHGPIKDQASIYRKQMRMLARFDVCMGGRVAEELVFVEKNKVTQLGHRSVDRQQATSSCRQ